MDLNDLLLNSVRKYPSKNVIKDGDRHYSYSQFHKRVCKLANALAAKNIKYQDKVALICPNCHAYLEIVFACAKIGAISEHFNWRLAPVKMWEMLEDSPATVVFISHKYADIYEYLKNNLTRQVTFIFVDETADQALSYEAFIGDMPEVCEDARLNDDDVAMQLYTSGTTGKAKGVMLTTANVVTQLLVSIMEGSLRHDEVYLCLLPLFHTTCISALQILSVGGEIVFGKSKSPEEIVKLLEAEGITRTTLVPYQLNTLVSYAEEHRVKADSLRIINYGGAPMSQELLERGRKCFRCGFHQAYGMTEMTATITVLLPDDHLEARNLCTVGKPGAANRVRVVNDSGQVCKTGETGEIVAQGKTMMKGYYNNPELTAAVIRDGWYHTGDIGYFDERGFLHLMGRKNDMIISGGENIYPKEVADCIRSMGKGIFDVGVIGVPDDAWGELVIAAVVKSPGAEVTAEDITNHCRENLASYKKPHYVCFLDKLPRNESGKIVKEELEELYIRNCKKMKEG